MELDPAATLPRQAGVSLPCRPQALGTLVCGCWPWQCASGQGPQWDRVVPRAGSHQVRPPWPPCGLRWRLGPAARERVFALRLSRGRAELVLIRLDFWVLSVHGEYTNLGVSVAEDPIFKASSVPQGH